MTHGDLLLRNLLVVSEDNHKVAGFVSWEMGGGYPEYWEYMKTLDGFSRRREYDWYVYQPETGIGKCLEEWNRDTITTHYSVTWRCRHWPSLDGIRASLTPGNDRTSLSIRIASKLGHR